MQHKIWGLLVAAAAPVWNQEPLTIQQAIERALHNNGAIEAGKQATGAAAERVRSAQGALLPQVSYTESWTRSNNQVFVFGSLLMQKQFTAANFDLRALNNAPFLNNFQSTVLLDQVLYDAGRRRAQIEAAGRGRELAVETQRRTEMQVITDTIQSYYGALSAQAALDAARQSVRSAEADAGRATNRRNAGQITDADVLAIRVHVAEMKEREIRANAAVEGARAALNHALGEGLDARFDLSSTLAPLAAPDVAAADKERGAPGLRPEAREAALGVEIADAKARAARAALWPEFYFRAGFEADRQRFIDRGGGNWMAAAGMRWSLFSGLSDRARLREASSEAASRRAMAKYVASGTQVETRRALLELRAAQERVAVAGETIALAEEAARIVKNRYDSGLADVTELIRTETALADTRVRHIDAIRDQRLAMLGVELASGTLSKDSRSIQ